MAQKGNKHKSRANVAEWGSKARKEESKQKRGKDKQVTRKDVLDETVGDDENVVGGTPVLIPQRIK